MAATVIIKGLSRVQANAIAMVFADGSMNHFLNETLMKDFFSSQGFKVPPEVRMAAAGDAENPVHEINYISDN